MLDNLFLLIFLASPIALVVGLVKPTVFTKIIKGEITRKKIAIIFGTTMVASLVLFGITTDSPKSDNNEAAEQPTVESTKVLTETEDTSPTPPVAEKASTSPAPTKAEVAPVKTQAATPVPTKAEDKPAPASSQTTSQKNAVLKAKSYLGYSAFSRDGLVAQLEYEQFSHADAVYGADNSGANWNEQAAKKAKSYMEYSAFSRGSLIEQLKYEKFTQAQAEYGANAVGL